MIHAIESKFGDSKRQHCAKHKLENVLGYIPKKQQENRLPELRGIFITKGAYLNNSSARFYQLEIGWHDGPANTQME